MTMTRLKRASQTFCHKYLKEESHQKLHVWVHRLLLSTKPRKMYLSALRQWPSMSFSLSGKRISNRVLLISGSI